MTKAADDYARDYTEPELRERLKEEIKASDRGAARGRWSARKSQLLTTEYEKAGGGYRHPDERTQAQRDLERWGDQEWQTSAGDGDARGDGGTRRYLPAVAWKLLSESERAASDEAKRASDDQFMSNPEAAREARAAAELLELTAREAVKAVNRMDSEPALERARRAEEDHGEARKTVLAAIERRRGGL